MVKNIKEFTEKFCWDKERFDTCSVCPYWRLGDPNICTHPEHPDNFKDIKVVPIRPYIEGYEDIQ